MFPPTVVNDETLQRPPSVHERVWSCDKTLLECEVKTTQCQPCWQLGCRAFFTRLLFPCLFSFRRSCLPVARLPRQCYGHCFLSLSSFCRRWSSFSFVFGWADTKTSTCPFVRTAICSTVLPGFVSCYLSSFSRSFRLRLSYKRHCRQRCSPLPLVLFSTVLLTSLACTL